MAASMKRSILELCFQWAMTFTLFVPSRLFVTSFSSSLPFLTNCCYFRCRSIVLSPSVLFSYNGVNGESDLQLNGHDIPIAATMQLHNENSSASCIDEKRTDGNVETADPHQSDTNASKSSASVAPSTPAETPQIDIESTGSFGTSTTNMFELVADLAAICLYQSDIRRDAIGKATGSQASSATNWIHEASAFALQKAMDQVVMRNPDEAETPSKSTSSSWMERDEITAWVRWCKSMPCPAVLDISSEFQRIVAKSVTTFSEEKSSPSAAASALFLPHIDQMPDEFLSRLGCRMIVLPSGTSLDIPLTEPSSSIVYGKLLYGGVTRARLLGSTSPTPFSRQRKAEVRTEIQPTQKDNVPAWMMYGGPDRVYEAVDMGPAAVLEVVLLPRGKTLRSCSSFTNLHNHGHGNFITRSNASLFRHRKNMIAANLAWSPEIMFDSYQRTVAALGSKAERVKESDTRVSNTPSSLSGSDRNEAFAAGFRSAVGGLQPQIDAIVRRVLDGRVIRPAEEDVSVELKIAHATNSLSISSNAALSSSLDAQELQLLGLSPVRGLLLYGPPGCGKTALARGISRALRARAPKIVSAPELLDRWVGGSEKLVRQLFAEAEAELAASGGDPTKSALHVVVIDEIDAVFRKRSSAEDSGEATRSSVVNQILSKLDGINSIPNLLMIGMTNRRELLDDALLRPGRLEVQVEIPLPNREGRREIFNIHFDALRKRGRLSRPLCCAIDAVPVSAFDADNAISLNLRSIDSDGSTLTKRVVQKAFRRAAIILKFGVFDLASDSVTGGFSGADIAGLVRCAGSLALSRARQVGGGIEGLLITLEDVKQALVEVKK